MFTIGDLDKFGVTRDYEDQVFVTLYDYLFRIDDVRGADRLFLP